MAGSSGNRASAPGRWLGDRGAFHAEGAFWDAEAGTLRYVDMLAGDVLTESPGGGIRSHLGDVVALIRGRRDGGYVVAQERGFALLDDQLRTERTIPVFDDRTLRMNEGACDAAGRLFCGSMAYDTRPGAGTLYRLDPDLSVHVALESVSIPNGLVWTADGARALHADTGERAVFAYAFDVDGGALTNRETFLEFAEGDAAPDGMALDEEGGLWIAMWGGGAVRRYDSSGTLSDVVEVPVTNVTSCAFGGASGTTLFVTTSRQAIAPGSQARAGQIYAVEVGVRGAPVHRFGG